MMSTWLVTLSTLGCKMLLYIHSSKIIKAGLVIEYFYAVQLLLLLK